MEDNLKNNFENRLKIIKDQLFVGDDEISGGTGLMSMLMFRLIDDETIGTDFLMETIQNILTNKKRLIENGGMFPEWQVKSHNLCKPHHAYACLNNELQFCVRHYDEDDWNDVAYVFPYMNPTKAYDIIGEVSGKVEVDAVHPIEDISYKIVKDIFYASTDASGDISTWFEELKEGNGGNINIAFYYEDKKRVILWGDDFIGAGIDDKLEIYEIADVIVMQDSNGNFHLTRNKFGKIDDEFCEKFGIKPIYK